MLRIPLNYSTVRDAYNFFVYNTTQNDGVTLMQPRVPCNLKFEELDNYHLISAS